MTDNKVPPNDVDQLLATLMQEKTVVFSPISDADANNTELFTVYNYAEKKFYAVQGPQNILDDMQEHSEELWAMDFTQAIDYLTNRNIVWTIN